MQDDHDSNVLGQRSNDQGIGKDQRGQQPKDKKRAQQSQEEGPAAYAPHQDEPTKPADSKKKGKLDEINLPADESKFG